MAVTRALGLAYSGIDLIRTPQDEHVFLEANSEPAWIWIEEATGLAITRAVAATLAQAGPQPLPASRPRPGR